MPKVKLKIAPAPWESFDANDDSPPERRPLFEVLGIADSGASRRGSTYYKTLFTCPREFAFKYILGFKPIHASEALTVGWLFHLVLETYYRKLHAHQKKLEIPKQPYSPATRIAWEHYWWGASGPAMKEALGAAEAISTEPGYQDTWATLERISAHYFDAIWKTDRWQILAVEETIEVNDEIEYSARLDLLIRDFLTRGVYIVEHKSARALTRDLIEGYQLDLQILGQNWLVRNVLDLDEYPPLKGTFVEITTKQQMPKYDRIECNPSAFHLAAFQESIESWQRLKGYLEGEAWPRALGKCSGAARGYSRCEFYEVCHGHPHVGVDEWDKADPPYGFVRNEVE